MEPQVFRRLAFNSRCFFFESFSKGTYFSIVRSPFLLLLVGICFYDGWQGRITTQCGDVFSVSVSARKNMIKVGEGEVMKNSIS